MFFSTLKLTWQAVQFLGSNHRATANNALQLSPAELLCEAYLIVKIIDIWQLHPFPEGPRSRDGA